MAQAARHTERRECRSCVCQEPPIFGPAKHDDLPHVAAVDPAAGQRDRLHDGGGGDHVEAAGVADFAHDIHESRRGSRGSASFPGRRRLAGTRSCTSRRSFVERQALRGTTPIDGSEIVPSGVTRTCLPWPPVKKRLLTDCKKSLAFTWVVMRGDVDVGNRDRTFCTSH